MSATLRVTMELLSDAIFGSGFSIPGGEDIAVCQDENGYPYLKGTTMKGLLRESLENLVVWAGGDATVVDTLLGSYGWEGAEDARRIHLTALTLEDAPKDPEDCYALRTFTSLADGIVKEGTLRTASCIRRGLVFSGELRCDARDVPLLEDALAGIKWAGTLRSRGFGSVRVRGKLQREADTELEPVTGRCIRYRLRTETPVLVTDLSRSVENSVETRGYIPGSAVRGMVMSALSNGDPEWFRENKEALLAVRFLDAVPVPEEQELPVLPSIKGFYETKEETGLESVVRNGAFTPGKKRAKLGTFCALRDGEIQYWSAKTGGSLRILRDQEETRPFQTRSLSAGQCFLGNILLEDEALAQKITAVLTGTVWLGADRFEGYGKCTVMEREGADAPAWTETYGYAAQDVAGKELYLLAISPLTMLNALGEPCGLDTETLAEKLGVERVEIRFCSTSLTEVGSYNRTWRCRSSAVRMYDRGSVFHLVCSSAPAVERLRATEREGLGIRRAEGYGQVLFLRRELMEGLRTKQEVKPPVVENNVRRVRDAEYRWVMRNAESVRSCGLSASQIGTIQSLCEQAIANGRDPAALYAHLDKNLNERGAKHGSRFEQIDRLVREVLEKPIDQTLEMEGCEERRLELLCMLFDYSRKEGQ